MKIYTECLGETAKYTYSSSGKYTEEREEKGKENAMIIQREKRHDRGPLHSHNIPPFSILNLFFGPSNFLLLKSVILDNVRHTQLEISNLFKVTFRFKQDEN